MSDDGAKTTVAVADSVEVRRVRGGYILKYKERYTVAYDRSQLAGALQHHDWPPTALRDAEVVCASHEAMANEIRAILGAK